MMKWLFHLVIALIFINNVEASLYINEVMYNPEGSDNRKEFVEIFNDENISLDGFIISDGDSNDTLKIISFNDSIFTLIVEEDFEIDAGNASVYSAGASIGNGLSFEDVITLYYPNGTIIDSMIIEKDVEGYSLELFENKWYQSLLINGTPGLVNSVIAASEQDFSVLEISEFLPDPEGYDDAAMPSGEWIEVYNSGSLSMDLRGLKLRDNSRKEILITDVNTLSGTIIPGKGFLVVYMNGKFGFLNNDGLEIIKFYDLDDNLIDSVSYEDSSEGVSWSKNDGVWQRSAPTPNEANVGNESLEDSRIEIVRFYDLGSNEKAEWGSNFRVRLDVYKGDTSRNAIKIWVERKDERVSKESSVNVYNKFRNYNLTLPIQLFGNCNKKFEDGTYRVKVDGLNKEDSNSISIGGYVKGICEDEKDGSKREFSYQIIDVPSKVDVGEEFPIKIRLVNNQDNDEEVSVWSYVYSGSWSLSGEREENMQNFKINAGDSKIIELRNSVIDTDSGDYKLKVKIKQADRKTEDEITKDIRIVNEVKKEVKESEEIVILEEEKGSTFKGLIYESTSNKAKRDAVYFLAGILALFSIYHIYREK